MAISTYNDIYLNSNTANKVIEKYYDELMTDFNTELRNILLNSHKRILYPKADSFDEWVSITTKKIEKINNKEQKSTLTEMLENNKI